MGGGVQGAQLRTCIPHMNSAPLVATAQRSSADGGDEARSLTVSQASPRLETDTIIVNSSVINWPILPRGSLSPYDSSYATRGDAASAVLYATYDSGVQEGHTENGIHPGGQ